MILPDVNVLLHAHNLRSPHHERARAWWDGVLTGEERVGLAWVVLLGFIRIATSRVVFPNPLSPGEALTLIEAWLEQPHVRILHPSPGHVDRLRLLLHSAGTGGNLTTDAHLAALALEHECTVYTTDVDFARFERIAWVNPLVL